jgi:hypothetical protein
MCSFWWFFVARLHGDKWTKLRWHISYSKILGCGRPSARVGSDAASTPLSVSPLRLALPSSRSLVFIGSSRAPRHHRCFLLHQSGSCRLLAQFVQCLPGLFPAQFVQCLPGLFPNLALSWCIATTGHRRCPCRWWLGAGVEAPQVVSSWANGAPTSATSAGGARTPPASTLTLGIDRPHSLLPCCKCMFRSL